MRNMIDTNVKAFDSISNQLFELADSKTELGKRYITTNEDEKKWLIEVNLLEILNFLPSLRALNLEFNETKYVVVIGANMPNFIEDQSILLEQDLNSGLVTFLISESYLKINTTINILEFEDNIMSQHKDKDYKGHDYFELLTYLEPIKIFQITENSLLEEAKLDRILVYIYSNNPKHLILEFNTSTLNFFSDISLVGSKNISYNLLLYSLLSTNFKHSFLELYRLVERLFPINYLKDFHEKALTSLNFIEFSSELENITSWRPKEEDALEKIFSIAKTNTKDSFNKFQESNPNFQNQNYYKYFYKLRNSIVHFRTNHEDFELNTNQWNLLIIATLTLIDEQYSYYNKILEQ